MEDQQAAPPIFESIDEYQAIMESVETLAARRQNANTLYIGINTAFLTALGVFLYSHLNLLHWASAVVASLITVALLPLNLIWLATLRYYRYYARIRHQYLREIEQEFRERAVKRGNQRKIGMYLRFEETGRRQGNSLLETRLATYFLLLYPVLSLIVIGISYLVQAHIIPPLSFP